jgi:ubiquitin C-terminal hydrolase
VLCSHKELLQADNKLHCTGCNSYQEAYKWVKIASFPPVLIIHFNRFAFTPLLEQVLHAPPSPAVHVLSALRLLLLALAHLLELASSLNQQPSR